MRLEAIKALRYHEEEQLNEDEQLLVAFVRAVASGTMTDRLWDRMTERLGTRGTVEYSCFVSFLIMTIRNIQSLTKINPSDEDIDTMIAEFENGTRPLPDPKAHIH